MDREQSAAFRALPGCARRTLTAIERVIGEGESAAVSYSTIAAGHVGRQSIPRALRILAGVQLIAVERGPRGVGIFTLSEGWRDIGEAEARAVVAANPPPPSQLPGHAARRRARLAYRRRRAAGLEHHV